MIGQTIGEAIAGGIQQASLNRRVDRILDRAGITGDRGDTQQSRMMVSAMLRAGGSDADILDFVQYEGVGSSLTHLDAALGDGTSVDIAADRAGGAAANALRDPAPEGLDADEIVVVAQLRGPSGNSIIANTISGGVGLADSFVS